MDNNHRNNIDKETAELLKEKTNEDHNRQKPNPADPNENKAQQDGAVEELNKPKKTN